MKIERCYLSKIEDCARARWWTLESSRYPNLVVHHHRGTDSEAGRYFNIFSFGILSKSSQTRGSGHATGSLPVQMTTCKYVAEVMQISVEIWYWVV